jgi:succinate-acetate transporter protein
MTHRPYENETLPTNDASYREMAVGNTFGATALSSYGGFWIAFAIILTPGGFQVVDSLESAGKGSPAMFYDSLGLFLMVSRAFNVYIMQKLAA